LPTTRFLFVMFLITVSAVAQEHLPSKPPSAVDITNASVSGYASNTAAASSLPDTCIPRRVRVIDKKFIAVMGALGGAESLRFTSRKLVLDNEFSAGAPWVTSVPQNQHLVVIYGGIFDSELLVAYEIKKPHSWLPGDKIFRRLWWTYPAAMTAIHTRNGVSNIRTQGPGGCTSIECEEQKLMP
jgi:hypothetical protein